MSEEQDEEDDVDDYQDEDAGVLAAIEQSLEPTSQVTTGQRRAARHAVQQRACFGQR